MVKEYWDTIIPNNMRDGRTVEINAAGEAFRPAWSSAFISHVVKKAGGGDRFRYSGGHCVYAQNCVRQTEQHAAGRLYTAMRPEEYVPVPGDIVHAGRAGAASYTYDNARSIFQAESWYPSHSDVVVSVHADEGYLSVIGGNTRDADGSQRDTVGRKHIAIDAEGKLMPRGQSQTLPWIMIMSCED